MPRGKPRYDELRRDSPAVHEEEAQAIRAIGAARDDLHLARAALLYFKGERPRPKLYIELDGTPVMDIKAAIAARSRAEAGPLDYIEQPIL